MTLFDFQKRLQSPLGKEIKLTINDNRSTMLSVKWEPDCTRVSLHRMFLNAPQNVMDELACYIRREDGDMTPLVKSFIEKGVQRLDYSRHIDPEKLDACGKVYDLKELYDALNWEYFNNGLALQITWFGDEGQRNRSKISFGLYYPALRLIKIHRKLDSIFCPKYVLSYIIYHEMLHERCPPFVDDNGKRHIHNQEFKIKERQFKDFDRSQQWINEHRALFF